MENPPAITAIRAVGRHDEDSVICPLEAMARSLSLAALAAVSRAIF